MQQVQESNLKAVNESLIRTNVLCYSIVELETSWENEICIHVELGSFIFFPI